MPVTEVLEALGSFEISLTPDIPREVLDTITYFGHVAIIPGRVNPAAAGDGLLGAARYVGVVRGRRVDDDRRTKRTEDATRITGVGMAFWLGDEDNKGDIYENAIMPASASFASTINMLLPASGAVTAGTIYSVTGSYSGRHIYETPRTAIQYVCDTMSTTAIPVGWRVNGDGTLDAGPESALYVTSPRCVIVKRGAGEDMTLRALPGSTGVARDVEDYSTRVVLLAEGEGESIATGTADLSPATGYKDLHGNPLRLTRLVSESDTTITNADTRAAVALSQYTGTRDALELSTTDYDVQGSFDVGDYVWVYDPDQGLIDTASEVTFRGERINPIKLRVAEATWPVTSGYTIAYRSGTGVWTDLTDYTEFEAASEVRITVGEFGRALSGAGTEPVGSRPNADTSVPGIPTLIEPFVGSAYLDARGFTRACVIISWNAPLNVDGSTILDGDHFEIRYAIDTDMIYPATWAQIAQVRWMDLQTWAQPFAAPDGDWQTMFVAWGEATAQLQDLSPGVGYDVQIRAVDKVGNTGAWGPVTTFVTSQDNIPPSAPAAPAVAGSRIAVQVTHELGKSSGGTFNLESDMDHLEIHVDYEPTFTPTENTLKGKAPANAGMIQAQIPVVFTVQVEETSARYVRVVAVDKTGNKSGPSDAATATALLIDDAHISDLTVSKVTAGTVSANWLLAASIRTAETGARVELASSGLQAYNAGGAQTVNIDSATGDVTILGQIISGTSGRRLEINPTATYLPEIRFYASSGSNFGYINGVSTGAEVNLGVNGGVFDDSGVDCYARLYLTGGTSEFAVLRADTQQRRGGYAFVQPSSAFVGYSSGGTDGGKFFATSTQGWVGWDSGVSSTANHMQFFSGRTRHIGRWADFLAVDSNEGIFTGSLAGPSSGDAVALSFGPTMDTQLLPIVAVRDNPSVANTRGFVVSASDATSFTCQLSGAANGAWSIYFWCYRI
ncbi:hypothetical protein SMD44_00915 [Streptomyces alboflavus]|uniref:Fibronectin type-III domain-containing protein n=1 Tax=Streptomyces alboflavus TaxID=67267 RepID=A0A1Z1W541_9ACTN|nr:fibronectin type III domain-containing protein [Streptomyces alboflavus]ARX81517.1 hypothetical protein SMD44_00915 [Streptomyces alboflavus]